MRRFFTDNGLTLTMLGLFSICSVGHAISGFLTDREERTVYETDPLSFLTYLISPRLGESVFENWESEFLQMACYVLLTAALYQRGSAESRPLPDEQKEGFFEEETEEDAQNYSWLFRHSLSLALFSLFAVSWLLHAMTGQCARNAEAVRHGEKTVSLAEYITSSQFWFEFFQNWQSEYLSVAALIVFSIYFREHRSPESRLLKDPSSKKG